MPLRRLLVALAAAALVSGCATGLTSLNDRFWVPGSDPAMVFLGAEYAVNARHWPPATLPSLPPMRTELIPDRYGASWELLDYPWSVWWNYDRPKEWPPL
jgi:hypothetical protein